MRKILVTLLAISGTSAFAWDYTQFQAFDNQVSIGYGMQHQTTTALGGGDNNSSKSNLVNLEGERLLNNGVWVDVNAQMVFGQGPTSNSGGVFGQQQQPVQSNYGVNGKVGYAFPLASQHLLVTPYALVGLNNNGVVGSANQSPALAGQTNANGAGTTTANQFYYTGGGGGRIEYRINHVVELYADQAVSYNWDQTGYAGGIQPQNFYQLTSTVGAKFNVVKDFQLGVRGFYQNDQFDASSGTPSGVAYPQAQNGIGGLVTVGLTY